VFVGGAGSIYEGYSLPVWSGDEELYFRMCVPDRWDGESHILVHIVTALAGAEAGAGYQLQLDWEHFTPNEDIVPATSNQVFRTRMIENDAQYQSYMDWFIILYNADVGDDILADDQLELRLRRIPIGGQYKDLDCELIIMHLGILFIRGDLLGHPENIIEEDDMVLFALIFLPLALMALAWAFRKQAFAFAAVGGWIVLAVYAYTQSVATWDVYFGLFWVSIGFLIIVALEAMALVERPDKQPTNLELVGGKTSTDRYIEKQEAYRERQEKMNRALGGKGEPREPKNQKMKD